MKEIKYVLDEEAEYVAAKTLPKGWLWQKYDDGSGCLISPENKKFMLYDLNTHEYQFDMDSDYELFPLSYFYGDGEDPKKFDPFVFMEKEIKKSLSELWMKEKRCFSFDIDYDGKNLFLAEQSASGSTYNPQNKKEFLEDCVAYLLDSLDPEGNYSFKIMEKETAESKCSVDTPLGKLSAVVGGDPSYPEIYTYIEREDGIEIDLVACEVKPEENIIKGYLYGDTGRDEYTHTHVWTADEINVPCD